MDKNEKCPYCGSNKNVIGVQSGYASVSANKSLTFKTQILYHVICLDCGSVIRSFVKNPEKLVINNDQMKYV